MFLIVVLVPSCPSFVGSTVFATERPLVKAKEGYLKDESYTVAKVFLKDLYEILFSSR